MRSPETDELLRECRDELGHLGSAVAVGNPRAARVAISILRRLLDVADARAQRSLAGAAPAFRRPEGLRVIQGGRP